MIPEITAIVGISSASVGFFAANYLRSRALHKVIIGSIVINNQPSNFYQNDKTLQHTINYSRMRGMEAQVGMASLFGKSYPTINISPFSKRPQLYVYGGKIINLPLFTSAGDIKGWTEDSTQWFVIGMQKDDVADFASGLSMWKVLTALSIYWWMLAILWWVMIDETWIDNYNHDQLFIYTPK